MRKHFLQTVQRMKKKKSITGRILKALLIIIGIPIILIWLLIILLYIPSVQRWAVNIVSEEISESSGYDIEIESVHLAFPLKLKIRDFNMSKNGITYIWSDKFDANVSFWPLLGGDVELNFVSLEDVRLDTKEMIPSMAIEGNIKHFRSAARNIELANEIANLRQVHLYGADLNIEVKDTVIVEEEETDEEPSKWIINLHKAKIENSSIAISIPKDTLTIKADIGLLRARNGLADLSKNKFDLRNLLVEKGSIEYDKGIRSKEEAPLEHLCLNNISLNLRNVKYDLQNAEATLANLRFNQPGGMNITESEARISANSTALNIERFSARSANGSYLSISTSVPWLAFAELPNKTIEMQLNAGLYKKDLAALLTQEQYDELSTFNEKIIETSIKAKGNRGYLKIDTMHIDIPDYATIGMNGYAYNFLDPENLEAAATLDCTNGNISKLMEMQDSCSSIKEIAALYSAVTYKEGKFDADVLFNGLSGRIECDAVFETNSMAYSADMKIHGIDLTGVLPEIPLKSLTTSLMAKGEGIDLFSQNTRYSILLELDSAEYDNISLRDICLNAKQRSGKSHITVASQDPNLKLDLDAETDISREVIKNRTSLIAENIDLKGLGLSQERFKTGLKLGIGLSTDMNKRHRLNLEGKDIAVATETDEFAPKDIAFNFETTPDSTYITAQNGDLVINGSMQCGYTELSASLDNIKKMFDDAAKNQEMEHYLQDYERLLPPITLNMECGTENIAANALAMNGMETDNIRMNLKIDAAEGLNMNAGIYGFRTEALNLDTIRMFTRQEGNRMRYLAGIRSTSVDQAEQKETYSALIYGYMLNDSLTTNFAYRDSKDSLAIKLGLLSTMKPQTLNVNFAPEAIFMGKKFLFHTDNYLRIGKEYSVEADITLENNNNSGIHLYTTPDSAYKYNANLELFNIDLEEVTGIVPYAPDISGTLNADVHFRHGEQGMLISSDIYADEVEYEGTFIGNEIAELVYFPKNDGTHYLDALLMHDEEEILHVNGNYLENDTLSGLSGTGTLTRFPLSITKAFTKATGIELDGYIDGDLSLKGKLSNMESNGSISFDSVYIHAHNIGTSLHMTDKSVNIEENKILFNDFDIYAHGNNPFKINGDVDISDLTDPAFNLRMNAKEYQLINSRKKKNSMLYGNLMLDMRGMIGGTLSSMSMYGNVTLLRKSNLTYVMLDGPIESEKELDGLVEFVNFNDTTSYAIPVKQEIDLGNTNINLNLSIEDGARINVDLDEARNNYVTTQGSGNLQIRYTNTNGLTVGGRYTMNDGEFKITLPIIPLKTLNISDGSEIVWSGEVFNPEINITALERVTSSVTFEDNSMLPVPFDVGVKVTNNLDDMALDFVMSSPANSTIQSELNALDKESMNRYAVTMLITGSYAGNKNISVSNAVSSFIDAKINDIAGTAMKNVSVNVGINDATNAETGSTYKNYSFSFSKRFWNDRITVVIGGEVNSGDHPRGNNGFINNASLEWKVSESNNRFLKLFYDKNFESILEGEVTETGVGYVYKRKLDRLKDLFIFRKKEEQEKEKNKSNGTRNREQSKQD